MIPHTWAPLQFQIGRECALPSHLGAATEHTVFVVVAKHHNGTRNLARLQERTFVAHAFILFLIFYKNQKKGRKNEKKAKKKLIKIGRACGSNCPP
jgi:hypothetical protein